MLAVAGTVPDKEFGLFTGPVKLTGEDISMDGRRVPVNRGTPALLGAALQTLNVFGKGDVTVFMAGDIGLGDGSRKLYEHLVNQACLSGIHTFVFHYLQPDADWQNRILFKIEEMEHPPLLAADAGFMYAAKMSGSAPSYDLFTPDAGELAFLADENAPHPFYTRGFILHTDNPVHGLVKRAYDNDNAPRFMLIKGAVDYIVEGKKELHRVDSPSHDVMEAIGGTGDTLTGIVSALVSTGMDIPQAAFAAARINRVAGKLACPTPATPIIDIINHIPKAVEHILQEIPRGVTKIDN
ncbi:MAG: sugar kinase [Desulfamplus sp.]|nr:sugar kinase [Desulfamplus sp.]